MTILIMSEEGKKEESMLTVEERAVIRGATFFEGNSVWGRGQDH